MALAGMEAYGETVRRELVGLERNNRRARQLVSCQWWEEGGVKDAGSAVCDKADSHPACGPVFSWHNSAPGVGESRVLRCMVERSSRLGCSVNPTVAFGVGCWWKEGFTHATRVILGPSGMCGGR